MMIKLSRLVIIKISLIGLRDIQENLYAWLVYEKG